MLYLINGVQKLAAVNLKQLLNAYSWLWGPTVLGNKIGEYSNPKNFFFCLGVNVLVRLQGGNMGHDGEQTSNVDITDMSPTLQVSNWNQLFWNKSVISENHLENISEIIFLILMSAFQFRISSGPKTFFSF